MNSKTKNREGVSDLNTDPKDPKSRLTDSDREKADVYSTSEVKAQHGRIDY